MKSLDGKSFHWQICNELIRLCVFIFCLVLVASVVAGTSYKVDDEEAANRAMSRLVNSEFGKKALAEWGSEDAVKHYAKMFEKYGVERIEKYSSKFQTEEVEKVMKNFNELEPLNADGFEKWRENVIFTARAGRNYEAEALVKLKNSGYSIEKIGVTDARGNEIADTVFKKDTRIIAELKSGNPSEFVDRGVLEQMKKYNEYATQNGIPNVWLISKEKVPQDIASEFERIGVIVKWAGEI